MATTSAYTLSTQHSLGARAFEIKQSDTGRVRWTTHRELIADEIVERVTDVSCTSTCSIHQPTRGWYLLVKSTDRAFSALQPFVKLAPNRTNPSKEFHFTLKHSSSAAEPTQDGNSGTELRTSTFLLRPGHEGGTVAKARSRLSLRAISESLASKNNSFSLVRDDHGKHQPILHFEDHPSILHTDTQGTLNLDEQAILGLNVDKTFVIAVAIAYLGFTEDQEAYLAAARG